MRSTLKCCGLRAVAGLCVGFGALTGPAAPADAHETDQYTMPLDRPMADLADYFDGVHFAALQAAVEKLNKETESALKERNASYRDAELNRIRSPLHVMEAVFANFDDAFSEIQDVEDALRSDWVKQAYPGQIPIWQPDRWIYFGTHYWLDPRQIILQFDSSTVKAFGVYFGTDKISHFHHMGRIYFTNYQCRLAQGWSEQEAIDFIVREYSTDSGIGEAGLLGFAATGVYSNADLAADYSGFKFCRNLTEPVFIKGALRPPMLVRKGEFWRLNKHVRPESGFFGAFVSDHWNEALNPSWWEWDIHDDVVAAVKERAAGIREFYTKVDKRPDDPAYYERLAHELTTMDGEEYGHCREWDRLLLLSEVCWPDGKPAGALQESLRAQTQGEQVSQRPSGPPAVIELPGR
jgi:hypothetical protein